MHFTECGVCEEEKHHEQGLGRSSGANQVYVSESDEKGDLAMAPARKFAVVTSMDARLDPAKFAGLSEADAHVIRNARGRASDDAIRSLVISYILIGTREWFVIHHTNCGMEIFTDEIIRGSLASSLEPATVDSSGWHDTDKGAGLTEGDFVDWLTIKDNEKSVRADVLRIRSHPLVPDNIQTTATSTTWRPASSLRFRKAL
jgi:carbonic anhydrase